ncbi:MAG TPA: radical SAM protein, partial [Chloroflexota bacterium]|nr:radical SAM protein [Chloroflexota bacterium]
LLYSIAERVPDLPWIRVLYLYPQRITPTLMRAMAELPQICNYVDIPLQHTHPDLLKRMRRPHDEVNRVVDSIREAIPEVAIRTTFIVGFPGETEEEHRHLLATIDALRFDHVGVFTYSPQAGTPAAAMDGQIPETTKERRWRETMELAQRISLEQNRRLVGQEMDVLVEGVGRGGRRHQSTMAGRSYRDAPEVDGLVFFNGKAHVGDLVRVRITSALEYDLVGEPTNGDEVLGKRQRGGKPHRKERRG